MGTEVVILLTVAALAAFCSSFILPRLPSWERTAPCWDDTSIVPFRSQLTSWEWPNA